MNGSGVALAAGVFAWFFAGEGGVNWLEFAELDAFVKVLVWADYVETGSRAYKRNAAAVKNIPSLITTPAMSLTRCFFV